MKNRMISLLLSLVFVFTLLPTAVLAATGDYTSVRLGANDVTSETLKTLTTDSGGALTWDAANDTLTLENINFEELSLPDNTSGIWIERTNTGQPVTIQVKGTNYIGTETAPTTQTALYMNCPIIMNIEAGASLNIYADIPDTPDIPIGIYTTKKLEIGGAGALNVTAPVGIQSNGFTLGNNIHLVVNGTTAAVAGAAGTATTLPTLDGVYYWKNGESDSEPFSAAAIPENTVSGKYFEYVSANHIVWTQSDSKHTGKCKCSDPVTVVSGEACFGGTAACTEKAVCTVCKSVYGEVLSHAWATTWSNDETHHWRECVNANCPVTGNSGKDGYAAHSYDNDTDTSCDTCGYVRTVSGGTTVDGIITLTPADLVNGASGEGWSFGESILEIQSGYTLIFDGTCDWGVINNGTIQDGTFPNGFFQNYGTITGGTFGNSDSPDVIYNAGTITGGTFSGAVDNYGTISDGSFNEDVSNDGTITGGKFTDGLNGEGIVTGTADLSELKSLDISGLQFGKDVKLPKAVMEGNLTYTGCDASTVITLKYYADDTLTDTWTVSGSDYSFHVERYKRTAPEADLSTLKEITHEVTAVSMAGYDITIAHPIWDRFDVTVAHTAEYIYVSNGNGTHSRTCTDATHTHDDETKNCSGGIATCTEKAVCEVCAVAYGETLPHTYGTDWKYDGTNHWHECACGAKSGEAAHSYGNDRTCDTCGYTKSAPYNPPSDPTYRPSIEESEGGDVTVTPKNPEQGDKVTITTDPDKGYEVDEVTVIDRKGDKVKVVDNGDGTYTFKQPSGRVTITVTFEKEACSGGRNCPTNAFLDLDADLWYHEAIDYVLDNGLMNGVSSDRFNPNGTTSRAMIVTILWRLEGEPVVNYLMQFDDVAEDAWCAEAIRWAASEGIVGGYGNGLFGTNDPITREQLAAILWRYAKHKGYDVSVGENTNILSYEDAFDIAEYAIPAMQWACGAGVMDGYGNGYLGPNNGATRAQAAQMLKNFIEKAAK